MEVIINVEFEMFEIVYFKTDPDQREFMITGYMVRPGTIIYAISHSDVPESFAIGEELTKTKRY